MLTGENGILTQAQNAKEETENAQAEEENILSDYENYINNVNGDVSQVDDSNPGVLEGSGTEQDPFIINSIEDLVVFADNVTKGTNNYQGQYVELGLSLDFNSDKSYVNPNREDYAQYGYNGKLKELLNTSGFIPIGKLEYIIGDENTNRFYGDFNGRNYKIYNLKIKQEKTVDVNVYKISGMFTQNLGTIKNICIENGNNLTNVSGGKYLQVGMLVGENHGGISNCYTTGSVTITSKMYSGCNVGGLVGANSGTIKECYNGANVTVDYILDGANRIGGLVGVNEVSGSIENVYNGGNISVEAFEEQAGNSSGTCQVGGIAGRVIGSIDSVYSTGNINSKNNNENMQVKIDGIGVKYYKQEGDINNCYYLENTITASAINTEITENGVTKSSAQMKTQEFLDLLNQDNSGMWKFSSGKNQGYPILYWE